MVTPALPTLWGTGFCGPIELSWLYVFKCGLWNLILCTAFKNLDLSLFLVCLQSLDTPQVPQPHFKTSAAHLGVLLVEIFLVLLHCMQQPKTILLSDKNLFSPPHSSLPQRYLLLLLLSFFFSNCLLLWLLVVDYILKQGLI